MKIYTIGNILKNLPRYRILSRLVPGRHLLKTEVLIPGVLLVPQFHAVTPVQVSKQCALGMHSTSCLHPVTSRLVRAGKEKIKLRTLVHFISNVINYIKM